MGNILRIVLAQINLTVGDIEGNLQKHIDATNEARLTFGADLIVFPELSLTGYPPEDLLFRQSFLAETKQAIKKLTSAVKEIYCVAGHPYQERGKLFNACSIIHNNRIVARYSKQRLPNKGVFDEKRYFSSGTRASIFSIKGVQVGIVICEDLWGKEPVKKSAFQGAQMIISPNASPFEIEKHQKRCAILRKRATENQLPIVYVNQIGGQDELIFDGGSMIVNELGKVCQFAGFFSEKLFPIEIEIKNNALLVQALSVSLPGRLEKIYQSLVLATRDYFRKNGLQSAVVGVSGGIDSAVTLAIAVDALGADNVKALLMPSRFTSQLSIEEALLLSKHLHVSTEIISIEPSYQAFLESLNALFAGQKTDLTEENLQARCRAVLLMAYSNQFGHLVLTTGNRSELAVGYCTLYGDMAGGFAILKDIPKTMVYELAYYKNTIHPVIPIRTIERAPTAELRPNQKDEDILPPYPILDQILKLYIEDEKSIYEIVAHGFEQAMVQTVVNLVKKNEYKRRQAAIGPRINHKAFGKDWRYPISNGFKE